MGKLIILLDMDQVITNTTKGFNERWKESYPDIPFVPYEALTRFNVEEVYPPEHSAKVREIWASPGLFMSLEPMAGALESIEEIARKAKEVSICTSPTRYNKTAAQEKSNWVKNRLGQYWAERLIITSDKTSILGDILIDDKPDIYGAQTPSWEHVLYTHPWNVGIKNKRRLTWGNWRTVLRELD